MAKILLADVKAGGLVSQVRDETVTFFHNGEECSVDIRIKQLPFFETEALLKRMHDGESVASDWISKALVDDKGEVMFTKKQVENSFVQTLASATFDKVWDTDNIKKAMQAKSKKAS